MLVFLIPLSAGWWGENERDGRIVSSYSTGAANGNGVHNNRVGGLVGNNEGTIVSSYSTVAVAANGVAADGGDSTGDNVGGLVGFSGGGLIVSSYSTGNADGGGGDNDHVGGLVGQSRGTIVSSYSTGDADGGGGDNDHVGGLAGENRGTIVSSYSTGDADGGGGSDDCAAGLVGQNAFIRGIFPIISGGMLMFEHARGIIVSSYGFGGVMRGSGVTSGATPFPTGVTTARQLTSSNSGFPSAAWDFMAGRSPFLKWVTSYSGTTYACDKALLPTGQRCPASGISGLIPGQ